MPQNRISASLKAADADKLIKALRDIRKLVPFLVDLNAEERRELFHVGDKSLAFIRKARQAALTHGTALPRGFDIDEFVKDADLLEALYPVVMELRQLSNTLEDTFALAGSEAYAGALVVYRSLRDNDEDGAFEGTVDALSERFARKSGSKKDNKKSDKPAPTP